MTGSIIETLHCGAHSLVVANHGSVETFDGRGIADLYRLLNESQALLDGADVADKIVGKGAAALMIEGKIRSVYADVISEPALQLFATSDVRVSYGKIVANIINRKADGICPVETLCLPCSTARECLAEITEFVKSKNR